MVIDLQGMSDERQHSLLGLLNGESSSLQGELVMGQLIETARSWAEQHNYPEVGTWVQGSCTTSKTALPQPKVQVQAQE
jgi:hypothetical protein